MLSDVIAGLSSDPRTLPCKYFYDERGAALFQKICELPEYYVTRTEIDILDRNRAEIASQIGPNIELIGLGTGLLAFVPYVGWGLGLITALVVAVIQSSQDMLPIAKVAAIFAAGMALDTAVLSPKIVGEKIGLHPVWLMFALFAFSYLFGFVGVLVAVPVAAAIGVLVRFTLEVYLESSFYRGPHAPDVTDAAAGGASPASGTAASAPGSTPKSSRHPEEVR